MGIKKIFLSLAVLVIFNSVSGDDTKASLTFIIDTTASMGLEIEKLTEATDDIFDAVLNSNTSQIDEFIIVTFNDPAHNLSITDAALRVKTKNRNEFRTALNKITTYGGFDCPEMSMSGVKLALVESKPNSLLYVFTDASAKDYKKYEEVKSLAQLKSIQVSFLLTGDCQDTEEEQYTVYDRLATSSGGQVFRFWKDETIEIVKYILENITSNRTILLRKTYKDNEACERHYNFTVDGNPRDIHIAVSAPRQLPNNDLVVIRPSLELEPTQDLVHLRNTLIVKIGGATGEYIIYIKHCTGITVVVSASNMNDLQMKQIL